jgi:hypothetical protein
MDNFVYRNASIDDVPFLVDTIIEAEKSGTDILTYSTIFGLSESESRKYIAEMLLEGVDGCELSISSFLIVESNGRIVGALSGWVEGINNISSTQLKGNLLSSTLPIESIKRALNLTSLLNEIYIAYIPGSIQKGAGYIIKEFRHKSLFSILTYKLIEHLLESSPNISEAYTQIYGSNISAIKANEKADFKVVMTKESANEEILYYLPSNKKLLMKKILFK